MTLDEAIEHARDKAKEDRKDACFTNIPWHAKDCEKCAKEHEQLADWLEELKELRTYKEKMEIQYLDDISNPLEPLKLKSALESEIFKYNYRKEHRPKDISPLDYTIMYALKHCLEEQIKESTK